MTVYVSRNDLSFSLWQVDDSSMNSKCLRDRHGDNSVVILEIFKNIWQWINSHSITHFLSIDRQIKGQTKQQNVFIKTMLALFMAVIFALGNIYLLHVSKFLTFLMYCKVASSRLSWLVAHPSFFRMFMKGKCDTYVLWPFSKSS